MMKEFDFSSYQISNQFHMQENHDIPHIKLQHLYIIIRVLSAIRVITNKGFKIEKQKNKVFQKIPFI